MAVYEVEFDDKRCKGCSICVKVAAGPKRDFMRRRDGCPAQNGKEDETCCDIGRMGMVGLRAARRR